MAARCTIVESAVPEPRPDEVVQLSAADRNYFRRRAAEEEDAAHAASCREARIAHEELAAAYRRFCASHLSRLVRTPSPSDEARSNRAER